jgi:endonuclease YncB( thermonuclease family)
MVRRLAVVLVLLVGACTDDSVAVTAPPVPSPPVTASPVTTSPVTTSPIDIPGAVPGTVDGVLDGDSLVITILGAEEEVRLLGVNAPERDECRGDEARAALTDLVEGEQVLVVPGERDQFDRLLGTVYLGGTNTSLTLLSDGNAIALTADHPDRLAYLQAEQDAFVEGLGIWDRTGCGAGSEELQVYIDFIEADPPGEDLDGEQATLGNDGTTTADLSGWVLRDESSANRYRIPNGTLLDPGEELIIWTGCGIDTASMLFWCADQPVWNNGGDAAFLLDPNGNIVSWLRYPGD